MSSRDGIKYYSYGDLVRQEAVISDLNAEVADACARLEKCAKGSKQYYAAHYFYAQAQDRYEDAKKDYDHMCLFVRW